MITGGGASCTATLDVYGGGSCTLNFDMGSISSSMILLTLSYSGDTNFASSSTTTYFPVPVVSVPALPPGTMSLPDAIVGTAYSAMIVVIDPPTTYIVTDGSLPPGLSLNEDTGEITGTPTTEGTYVFSVTSTQGTFSYTHSPYAIVVSASAVLPIITSTSLPVPIAGSAYTGTIAVTGSPEPTCSVTNGSLPPGLSLDAVSCQITGTPDAADAGNSYTVTITATNSEGTASQSYTIVVIAPLTPPVITTASLPDSATIGTAYAATVVATGSPAPTFSVTSGSLPDGLTLNEVTGVISGTPTTADSYTFTITATNSEGTAAQDYTIVVSAPALAPPVITTASLPGAIAGTAYAGTVAATGYPVPTFSVTSGSLPDGLTLNAATGVISGTPTTEGSYTFAITATNSEGTSTPVTFTIDVSAPAAAATGTTTALTVPATARVGQNVTASATVAPASGTVVPTGSVTVSGGGASCTATLNSVGKGSCTLTFATAGSVTLTASYAGDANFAASTGTALITVAAAVTAGPGPHDGIYHIINADGSPGDYLSVHSNGSDIIATIYRSASPVNAASFALTDGGASVATIYRWGSWDLYNGTLSGSSATLTGYSQYGLCNASVSISFGQTNTIRVVPTGLSDLAPAGTPASSCNPSLGYWPTLTLQQESVAPATATVDGIYRITNADSTLGDYVSVHTNAAGGLIATVYRSASPDSAQGFDLRDGGEHVATLYRWGSWDLYDGALSGSTAALTGYAQYGLCKATGSTAFGQPQTITIIPNGPSEFAPAGPQPSCSGAGTGELTITREF